MTEEWECLHCGARVPPPVPRRPFNFHPPCANSGMGVLVPVNKSAPEPRALGVEPVPPSEEAARRGP